MHEDSTVDAHDVLVKQHHRLPPVLLYIVLQFHTILPIIIDCSQSIVYIAAGEHETIFFTMTYNFLENIFLCHIFIFNFVQNYFNSLAPQKILIFFCHKTVCLYMFFVYLTLLPTTFLPSAIKF